MKDVGMRIRIEPELRDQFVSLCRDNDTPAAQVLRAFMREFVKTNRLKTHTKMNNRQIDEKIIVRKQALD